MLSLEYSKCCRRTYIHIRALEAEMNIPNLGLGFT